MIALENCPVCDTFAGLCRVVCVDGQTHLGRYCDKCQKRLPELLSKDMYDGNFADLFEVKALKENRMKIPSKVRKQRHSALDEAYAQSELKPRPTATLLTKVAVKTHAVTKNTVMGIPITEGKYARPIAPEPYQVDSASVSYREYMKSAEWKAKSDECIARFRGRCAVCYGTVQLQAHHRTYLRLGCELPEDLTCLCGDCHCLYHGIMQKHPK